MISLFCWLSTWCCPHLLLIAVHGTSDAQCPQHASSYQSIFSAIDWWDRQMDGQSNTEPLPRPCSAYYVGSINNVHADWTVLVLRKTLSHGKIVFGPASASSLELQQLEKIYGIYIYTHTHTQPFNSLWSGTTRVGQYQKKHSPTHTHPDHRTSFIIFLHLQRKQ